MIDIVLGWDWNLIAQILDRRRSRLSIVQEESLDKQKRIS